MKKNNLYETIGRKLEEWIWYDEHKPDGNYFDNIQQHDEYRRWHDRDCVLTGGILEADTIFSLWRPLRNTIIRLNDENRIQSVGDINRKYRFIRELIKGDNMEKLLPAKQPIVEKLSTLFELGMGRENVFLLPDRKLNTDRGRKPYEDYVPVFLSESFAGGVFAHYWSSPEEHIQWIIREHLEVFFDGNILPGNIKDLSGSGDVSIPLPPEGAAPMECMLDNYISILKERRKLFDAEELRQASEWEEMMNLEQKTQGFRDRITKGEPEALAQMKYIMNL